MSERKQPQFVINEVAEGWHAPGYRDPELHLKTTDGKELHVKLTPQAFVELHNALCSEMECIDGNGLAPLDMELYPFHTVSVSTRRTVFPPRVEKMTAAEHNAFPKGRWS